MEVKRDDKQSGRAVSDMDCRGSYEGLLNCVGASVNSLCTPLTRELRWGWVGGVMVWFLSLGRH